MAGNPVDLRRFLYQVRNNECHSQYTSRKPQSKVWEPPESYSYIFNGGGGGVCLQRRRTWARFCLFSTYRKLR